MTSNILSRRFVCFDFRLIKAQVCQIYKCTTDDKSHKTCLQNENKVLDQTLRIAIRKDQKENLVPRQNGPKLENKLAHLLVFFLFM